MENLFNDKTKVMQYAEIQNKLCNLTGNSSDEEIDNFIKEIPQQFLDQKEDLMIISQLIAYYGRNNLSINKRLVIKLFEKLKSYLQKHLQNESSFFWQILGGILFLKLWFYEENLITIEEIIQNCRNDRNLLVTEYFLPEIIEKETEIYEKEFKSKFDKEFSKEYLANFKEIRRKYFEWIRNSSDYTDPIYKEIESNKLRLSIKTDDVESFQKIISNLNISIDSEIMESIFEYFYRIQKNSKLIEYAIEYNSNKIIKYLLMNEADCSGCLYISICQRNYDIFHIIESKMLQRTSKDILECAVCCWNKEIVEYSFDNYEYSFLESSDIDKKYDKIVLAILYQTFFSLNFDFFVSTMLPFLERNPRFVNENINEIVMKTVEDQSGFFMREFLKHKLVDVNYHNSNLKSILVRSIEEHNTNAVEALFQKDELDIVSPGSKYFSAFQIAVSLRVDLKIIELFCNHPDFDINWTDERYHVSAYQLCITKGNSYGTEYLFNNIQNINDWDSSVLISYCIENDILMTLKILLKHYFKLDKSVKDDDIIDKYAYKSNSKHISVLKQILKEIRESLNDS